MICFAMCTLELKFLPSKMLANLCHKHTILVLLVVPHLLNHLGGVLPFNKDGAVRGKLRWLGKCWRLEKRNKKPLILL